MTDETDIRGPVPQPAHENETDIKTGGRATMEQRKTRDVTRHETTATEPSAGIVQRRSSLFRGPLGVTLALATLLTLAGAALSAFAVSSEPTMRAEDSNYETTAMAVLVGREIDRTPSRAAVLDRGATHRDDYGARARELGRSL